MSDCIQLHRVIQFAQSGDRLLAKVELEPILQEHPDHSDAWVWHAWLADSPELALQSLRTAFDLDPSNELAAWGLAWMESLVAAADVVNLADEGESTPEDSDSVEAENENEAEAIPDSAVTMPDSTMQECETEECKPTDLNQDTNIVDILAIEQGDDSRILEFEDDTEADLSLEPHDEESACEAVQCDPIDGESSLSEGTVEVADDAEVVSQTDVNGADADASVEVVTDNVEDTVVEMRLEEPKVKTVEPVAECDAALEAEANLAIEADLVIEATKNARESADEMLEVASEPLAEETVTRNSEPTVASPDTLLEEARSLSDEVESAIHPVAAPQPTATPAADRTVTPSDDGNESMAEAPVAEAPVAEAPVTTEEESSETVAPLILTVDDSPTVQKLVKITLEQVGYEVITASNGVEALNLLAKQRPSLILSDINMPRLNGYQLCKLVKKHARTKAIPVLLLSGKDGVFDKLRGQMVGCCDYVTKPFESHELVGKVRKYSLAPVAAVAATH